jgi:molybdopterin/thiamine biosynthesis adenylyltransferase
MNVDTARSHPGSSIDSRFERHGLVPGWDQSRLAGATAVVVGVGALGNEVARLLALAGIGGLILCDPDRVAASNLSRCGLFRESDVGRLKVEAAAEALVDLSPALEVRARPRPLVHGVGLAELRDASLVLSCLDSRSARLDLSGRCSLVRARWIDGGTHPWGGEVRPYLDPDGPCYGCSLTAAERAVVDEPWSCLDARPAETVGASAPISALVGSWMALIAVRTLMPLPLPAGTLLIDGSSGTTGIVRQVRDPECPLHHPLGPARRVPVGGDSRIADLRAVLEADQVPLAWMPVQERVECRRCGFAEERWGLPSVTPCPRCRAPLRPRTTLELDRAPGKLPLRELGIPLREILAVRTPGGMAVIELTG